LIRPAFSPKLSIKTLGPLPKLYCGPAKKEAAIILPFPTGV